MTDTPVLSIEQCDQALSIIDAALEPCEPKRAMVLLDNTLALYGSPENWDEIATFYLEAIEDIPLDLLEVALKHVRMTCKWFPKPVEIRFAMEHELWNRHFSRQKIQYMKAKQLPGKNLAAL